MRRFIFVERNEIYTIDLQLSLSHIDSAFSFVKSIMARGGQVLLIRARKQAREAIAKQATRVGIPYVNQRWLGGMLTNFHTVTKQIQCPKELEGMDPTDSASGSLTKKELLHLECEKNKLSKILGGTRDMVRTPQAVWMVDTKKEHLAVDEARKLRVLIVGILDTDYGPDEVDYAVPDNGDVIRSAALLVRIIVDAVTKGLIQRSSGRNGEEAKAEPIPDWEHEPLAQDDSAAAKTPEISEAPAKTESE